MLYLKLLNGLQLTGIHSGKVLDEGQAAGMCTDDCYTSLSHARDHIARICTADTDDMVAYPGRRLQA